MYDYAKARLVPRRDGSTFITQKRWNENTSDNVTMIRLFDEKTNRDL